MSETNTKNSDYSYSDKSNTSTLEEWDCTYKSKTSNSDNDNTNNEKNDISSNTNNVINSNTLSTREILKRKITKISKNNNLNIIYLDENLNKINDKSLIELINKNYTKFRNENEITGGQAAIKFLENNLIIRISNDFEFSERKYIQNNIKEIKEYMEKYKLEDYNQKIKNIDINDILLSIEASELFDESKKIRNIYKNITEKEVIDYFIEKGIIKTRNHIGKEQLEKYKIDYMKEVKLNINNLKEIYSGHEQLLFIRKLKAYISTDNNLRDYKKYIIEKELSYYIEDNNEILSHLKGIGSSSTIPINTFIIVGENGYKKIETLKLKEKGDLKKVRTEKTHENLSSIFRIEQLIKIFKNEHIAGIIHRDIKPLNILVDKNDKLTATDYGITNIVGKEKYNNFGTPIYMAPEIAKTKKITQKADIYSLGIIFFEELLEFDNIFEFLKNKLQVKNANLFRFSYQNTDELIYRSINENIIFLDKFLPNKIINNINNKTKIELLKTKLVELLKKMLVINPDERITIFEVEKEFDNIKMFILENFKKIENNNLEAILTTEDLLFLNTNKLQQIQNQEEIINQEKIKNKKLYDLKEFNINTIWTATTKFKNSLEKLLTTQEGEELYREGVLFNINNKGIQNELDDALNILELKKSLSEEAKECLNILKECLNNWDKDNIIPENNTDIDYELNVVNERILDFNNENNLSRKGGFYEKLNNLKNRRDIKEYLIVTNKLSQLRELKLAIEIQKLEQIGKDLDKNKLKEEINKIKELRNDAKLTIRIYNNKDLARKLFVKNEQSENFENLFNKFQKKENKLRHINEQIIHSYINLIPCFGINQKIPEILFYFIKKINNFAIDVNYINLKLLEKAIKDKNIGLINFIITKEKNFLINKEILINKIITAICSEEEYFKLLEVLISKNKQDINLCSNIINTIYNNISKDNDKIKKILINNIDKFVSLFDEQKDIINEIFVPFEIICKNEYNEFNDLIDGFVNKISENSNIMEKACNLFYKDKYINILDKLFLKENIKEKIIENIINNNDYNNIYDLAYKEDCSNIVESFFENEILKTNINFSLLLSDAIKDKKNKIAKQLIDLDVKLEKRDLENLEQNDFDLFKENLIKMANINTENIEKIKNIKIQKSKNIFEKNYIDNSDFEKLCNLLDVIKLPNVVGGVMDI